MDDTHGAAAGRHGRYLVRSWVHKIQIARKDRLEARERHAALDAKPTVAERQQSLAVFYERYEDFVETLCDSAQYGPTAKLEQTYADQKAWIVEQYAEIQPFVRSYLRASDDDPVSAVTLAPQDAFEALIAPETLSEFLRSDDGGMISRISRTREAINLYAEHLRQLSDKTG